MFGISFTELLLIATVALMVVGPSKLPKMLGTLGKWTGKLRRISSEMRQQTGIDDLLRQEGIKGGLNELRGIVRGDLSSIGRAAATAATVKTASKANKNKPDEATGDDEPNSVSTAANVSTPSTTMDPYEGVESDFTREYPVEGCDAGDALPDDLWTDGENQEPEQLVSSDGTPLTPADIHRLSLTGPPGGEASDTATTPAAAKPADTATTPAAAKPADTATTPTAAEEVSAPPVTTNTPSKAKPASVGNPDADPNSKATPETAGKPQTSNADDAKAPKLSAKPEVHASPAPAVATTPAEESEKA